MKNIDLPSSQKPSHIYEIDLLRAIVVFSVVANHSLSYTNYQITSITGIQFVNFISHALHYNREAFMFITGLVLTYVYYHRKFSVKSFWIKRVSLVLIPYILWSVIYVVLNNPGISFVEYVKLSYWDILTGEASFQLYYILLSLQFYIIFPLFLLFIKKVAHRPWHILAVSFIIQFIILYFDFYFLQTGPYSQLPSVKTFVHYQDRIVFMYQFFFILGGFAAVYMDTLKSFFKKSGQYLFILFITSLSLYAVNYYIQLNVFHATLDQATSVLQPSVAIYSTVVIIFYCYLAYLWAERRKWYRLIKLVAVTSFGIYFVHVIMLGYVMQFLFPLLPSVLGTPLKMITVLITAFGLSVLFCYVLLKIPFLSWTIGRRNK